MTAILTDWPAAPRSRQSNRPIGECFRIDALSPMKKLINDPENVVKEALKGMELACSDLIKVHYNPNFVMRADAPVKDKVALISGGGSGHEPMHGGFVGKGMLDAACPGAVFTSPTPDQINAATKAVAGAK